MGEADFKGGDRRDIFPAQRADEVFDVVDAEDRVVGRESRAEVHRLGLRHRAVHVLVTDGRGRWLLQRRSAGKDAHPRAWTSSACGHLDAGEGYAAAARRELAEELGWRGEVELREVGAAPASPETEHEFVRVMAAVLPGPFAPSPSEVEELRWVTEAELEAWLRAEPGVFAPSFRYVWWRFGAVAEPLPSLLWRSAEDVWQRIRGHRFLAGLVDGTLPEAAFRRYVEQDALYLRDFGRGLALLAAAAEEDEDRATFCRHAANAIAVERALHAGFLQAWGSGGAEEPSDACLLYTSWLLRVARERPYLEAVAAFLPCYWIYREVGRELSARGSPNPMYARWIATYGGGEFDAVVREVLAIVERAGAAAGVVERARAAAHFRRGVAMELGFWEEPVAWLEAGDRRAEA